MCILIGEDDAALAAFVRKGLEAEHYAVDVFCRRIDLLRGGEARETVQHLLFDLSTSSRTNSGNGRPRSSTSLCVSRSLTR